MVTYKCVVADCLGKYSEDIILFRFPTDPALKRMWCENLHMDRRPSARSRVCSEHFAKECFRDKHIRRGSVPTIALGGKETPPHKSYVFAKKKSNKWRKCAILGCTGGKRFFSFPKEQEKRKLWLDACNLDKTFLKKSNSFLCEKHFEANDLQKLHLKRNCLPVIKKDQPENYDYEKMCNEEYIETFYEIYSIKSPLTIENCDCHKKYSKKIKYLNSVAYAKDRQIRLLKAKIYQLESALKNSIQIVV